MTRTTHVTHKLPLHVRHAAKIAKVAKHSRLWLEISTLAGTAYETRVLVLMVASILWIVVDITLVLIGRAEEL